MNLKKIQHSANNKKKDTFNIPYESNKNESIGLLETDKDNKGTMERIYIHKRIDMYVCIE